MSIQSYLTENLNGYHHYFFFVFQLGGTVLKFKGIHFPQLRNIDTRIWQFIKHEIEENNWLFTPVSWGSGEKHILHLL